MFYFLFSCADLLPGNCLLTGFNISIKIVLAKRTFLFWILLCYLLNMSSFCIDSISWCCFVVPLFSCLLMFHSPAVFQLFCQCSVVPPVFRCSVSVPVFRQRSGVPSVCRCFAGAPCSVVPRSGVPSFVVCPQEMER